MSRIGKLPVIIPSGVEVSIEGQTVKVKGPKGELSQTLNRKVKVEKKENEIIISVSDTEDKLQRSLWGLSQRLISNLVMGVTEGFSKKLEVIGVGYKAAVSGKVLNLQLGYSHPIDYTFPAGIEINVEKNVITVSGADKQQVGQTASEIRAFRKPEPYKGKGIRYVGEEIIRKEGKTAAKGA